MCLSGFSLFLCGRMCVCNAMQHCFTQEEAREARKKLAFQIPNLLLILIQQQHRKTNNTTKHKAAATTIAIPTITIHRQT